MAKEQNIIIGEPLCTVDDLGIEVNDITLRTNERYLPEILVRIGLFNSKSEVRKNRPDLVRVLDKLDFEHIKIGKNHIWIVVGK